MNEDKLNIIKEMLSELKIPGIKSYLTDKISEAYKQDLPYEEFLQNILEIACDARHENGKKNRIRNANFPYKKYLEDLISEYLPQQAEKKLKELKTLEFIKEGRNVILAGPPGTAKTHIGIGLGIEACNQGYKVYFGTVPLLVNELKECRSEKRLRQFEMKFEKYDLVIVDELGYISFDKEGSELLFTYLSLRAERKSTLITTNLSFDRWDEIFKDPVLTAAMIDRLTHKAYVLNMNGSSYRMKETKDWLQNQ
ncbi:MAG: IS21-like element helper ATPase IstB [Anaerovoracaceae bacterium]|jgi:DNA replication protein DnaC